jgi:hypothetical protein
MPVIVVTRLRLNVAAVSREPDAGIPAAGGRIAGAIGVERGEPSLA